MQNEIVINAEPGETRVAILERSTFTELHIERDNERSVVGNVIKGRVSRVLPGMQAAFVDIGLEKAGFLYVGDYYPILESNKANGNGDKNNGQRRRYGRSRTPPKIETVLREGQDVVVQIAKEPIGTKGARITSNISLPGRHLVLTPGSGRVGVSRRIDSDKERRRLREIVERLRIDNLGFIIRTAGHGVRESDLEADIRYLTSVWHDIKSKMETGPSPSVLYAELDLPLKMIRDFANAETSQISIDSEVVYNDLKSFVNQFVADPKPKILHYTEATPIFDKFSLEEKIHDNLERKVMLKSGGHLVFDQGEALTAIDVNTGRFTGKRDLEDTVLRTNLEAVREVVYQLRFRNIGGLIIIDLIDMEPAAHREKVYRALQDALRTDKARTNILKISELGLVEMTRKRTRENLLQTLCEPCDYCEGRGFVLSSSSVAFKILRNVRNDLPRFSSRRIAISVNPHVAEQLLRGGGTTLVKLGEELGREIEVRARPGIHQEQFEITALDSGPPVSIPLRWLDGPGEKKDRKGRRRSSGADPTKDGEKKDEEQAPEEVTIAAEAQTAGESAAPATAEQTASDASASFTPSEEPSQDSPEGASGETSAAEAVPKPEPLAVATTEETGEPVSSDESNEIETRDETAESEEKEREEEDEQTPLGAGEATLQARDDDRAAAAAALDATAMDSPEVLDDQAELRILPASRQPEEP
jgi:ribonuclease G